MSPVARGVIVTISALVAAGIAVYESPQIREWVNSSRRKIALALHSLGDGIQPPDPASPPREDISMTEDSSDAARERRNAARQEILRRSALLEVRRRTGQMEPPSSFDDLVDEDGNLWNFDLLDTASRSEARSTGVEYLPPQPLATRRGAIAADSIDAINKSRLHLDLPPQKPSQPHSHTLVEFTPTSEISEMMHDAQVYDRPGEDTRGSPSHQNPEFDLEADSRPSSSHTGGPLQTYHTHLDSSGESQQSFGSPFAGLRGASPTSTTTRSYSDMDELEDISSDGTLSDLGRSSVGAATPASWSEVGSMISGDDGHY